MGSILGQIVRQSIISFMLQTSQFSSSEDYNISISRKMLTNIFKTLLYNNRPPYLLTVNYFQTARTICAKNIHKKLLKFITSKWERLNKSEPTLLKIML